jgi:uncharacterized protein
MKVLLRSDCMQKNIAWRAEAWEGQEQCSLSITPAGIEARGEITGVDAQGAAFEIDYVMNLSPDWEVYRVFITDATQEGVHIDLRYEEGRWQDDSGTCGSMDIFDDVALVDISRTPLTNTLPIKVLSLAEGASADIDVLFIDIPSITLRRVQQRYTYLGNNVYSYGDDDFTAEITVDEDGLVVSYPGLFSRVDMRE